MSTIRQAVADDLPDVLEMLNGAASWLTSMGLDQWASGFGAERIGPLIERGEVYVVHEFEHAVATVAISDQGDTDFWTPEELSEPSIYVAKLAAAREYAGMGIGELLLRWAVDLGARRGARWVRLDAWRTNQRLHDFYRRAGWSHVRTVELDHRRSGALFQHPATADLQVRETFKEAAP
ncbi:N-acetyltransferase family protein [Actinomadura citrea]|uniref:GNAT family N-acetyltransferase n=1 Tax=Actinomadura citrea TaxID=46158 RepID=UPI003CE53CC7